MLVALQLHHILGIYGCYIIERSESELDQSIFSSSSVHSRSPLALYRHNIHMVSPPHLQLFGEGGRADPPSLPPPSRSSKRSGTTSRRPRSAFSSARA